VRKEKKKKKERRTNDRMKIYMALAVARWREMDSY